MRPLLHELAVVLSFDAIAFQTVLARVGPLVPTYLLASPAISASLCDMEKGRERALHLANDTPPLPIYDDVLLGFYDGGCCSRPNPCKSIQIVASSPHLKHLSRWRSKIGRSMQSPTDRKRRESGK
jgi:hypothetical protein